MEGKQPYLGLIWKIVISHLLTEMILQVYHLERIHVRFGLSRPLRLRHFFGSCAAPSNFQYTYIFHRKESWPFVKNLSNFEDLLYTCCEKTRSKNPSIWRVHPKHDAAKRQAGNPRLIHFRQGAETTGTSWLHPFEPSPRLVGIRECHWHTGWLKRDPYTNGLWNHPYI